jgi:hypothetical protein
LENNHADKTDKDHGSSAELIDYKRANGRKDEIDCGGAYVDAELLLIAVDAELL